MQMFGGAHFHRQMPLDHCVHINRGIFSINIRSIHGKQQTTR